MSPALRPAAIDPARQQGSSLLEVLVTLAIVAVALLGTAALQAKALQLNQGGQFRAQAVFLVADIAERMEANKAAAVAGAYVLTSGDTPPSLVTDCSTAVCSSSTLATYDILQWQAAVAAVLPQGSWSVARTATGNPSTYSIAVSWVDRRGSTTYATSGTGESFTYTATRTIFN